MDSQFMVIPATPHLAYTGGGKRLRVAAYVRVSTDSEEQMRSYETQKAFYKSYIQREPEWTFTRVYADEGRSGTSVKGRKQFEQMITDALHGQIDLILTKSISRFARNTLDAIQTVRELKKAGVGVLFEKENLHTLDAKSEIVLTLLSSLAQEESRSISQNITWGIRKRYANGQAGGGTPALGYRPTEGGRLEIFEPEAEAVRHVFQLALTGISDYAIANIMNSVPDFAALKKWGAHGVGYVLENEIYKGCKRLQKTFTVDYLSRKRVPNSGELPQYVIANAHEAIVPEKVFDLVQFWRKFGFRRGKNAFSSRCFCGVCGKNLYRRATHSGTRYQKFFWRCAGKHVPPVTDGQLERSFLLLVEQLRANTSVCVRPKAFERAPFEDAMREQVAGMEERKELLERLIADSSHADRLQPGYVSEYEKLVGEFEGCKGEYERLERMLEEGYGRFLQADYFVDVLEGLLTPLEVFDRRVWQGLVCKVTVSVSGVFVYDLCNGGSVSVEGVL